MIRAIATVSPITLPPHVHVFKALPVRLAQISVAMLHKRKISSGKAACNDQTILHGKPTAFNACNKHLPQLSGSVHNKCRCKALQNVSHLRRLSPLRVDLMCRLNLSAALIAVQPCRQLRRDPLLLLEAGDHVAADITAMRDADDT